MMILAIACLQLVDAVALAGVNNTPDFEVVDVMLSEGS